MSRTEILRIVTAHGADRVNAMGKDLSGINLSGCKLDGIAFGTNEITTPDTVEIASRGADLSDAYLAACSLRRANFGKTCLSRAKAYRSDMTEASFWLADLSDVVMTDSNLQYANFYGANLTNALLLGANLDQANLVEANLNGTKISRKEIGDKLLQEDMEQYKRYFERWYIPSIVRDQYMEKHLTDRYREATIIYGELQLAFAAQGFNDDARWAYLKERHMEKTWFRQQAICSLKARNISLGVSYIAKWFGNRAVEILCGYGESIWRVLGWMLALLFVFGPLLVAASGGIAWTNEKSAQYLLLPTAGARFLYVYYHYLLYTLDAFTTANYSGLAPINDTVRIVSGLMSLVGLFLAGLLGFVAGNRIRNR